VNIHKGRGQGSVVTAAARSLDRPDKAVLNRDNGVVDRTLRCEKSAGSKRLRHRSLV
jgi:hypothetical protein